MTDYFLNQAPPSYSELKHLNEENDEEINTNFYPLYAYVNDYKPPPYSMVIYNNLNFNLIFACRPIFQKIKLKRMNQIKVYCE